MTAKKDTYISAREARLEDENMNLRRELHRLQIENEMLKNKLQRKISLNDKTQKMGRPVDDKLHLEIWKLREQGYSIRAISELLDCSTSTVQRVIKIMTM